MLIYFRTRGGASQGWGNIVRLTTVIKFLNKKKIKTLVFFEGDRNIHNYFNKNKINCFRMKENISIIDEKKIYANFHKPDVFIIEMINCNYQRQILLKKHSKMLVVFDDILSHKYIADVVISMQNRKNKIIKSNKTKFVSSYNFFPYREDLINISKKKKTISPNLRKILVILGGGKYDVAFYKIAKAVKKLSFNPQVDMILGHSNYRRLRSSLKKINSKLNLIAGTDKVSRYLKNTDLAIVSGGYTKLEAAASKTPLFAICTQWHQIELSKSFKSFTGAPYLGHMTEISINDISRLIEKFKSSKLRKKLKTSFEKKIKTEGVKNIYNFIQNEFQKISHGK